ncbi:unnamed protein product [Adineta ricciae]|uniref:Uncharacterized protein n=3 Tax=Adineta ricciae TaxID=249248 RepID=A0A814E8L1_ADIRI|nr:unnamed protein product [Adineta ricciae]
MNKVHFSIAAVLVLAVIRNSECFTAGWGGLIPLTSTEVSSSGTTHYAITECALLRIAADYLTKVHGSTDLDSIGSSTGVCSKVKDDFNSIENEVKRLRVSSTFRSAVYAISTENVLVDGLEWYNERSHFDGETFTQASGLVAMRLNSAKSNLGADNLYHARAYFGQAMHTLQDFYAHSNWIELGQTEPNTNIGSGIILGKYASKSMPTCRNCNSTDCAKDNILPEIIKDGWLTSGYFGLTPLAKKPLGKCSHGGSADATTDEEATGFGINKDYATSDHGMFYHYDAARVAYEATKQKLSQLWTQFGDTTFGRFLGLETTSLAIAIDTTGSMAPYIELVKQMAIRIVQSTTGDSAVLRPRNYILSPFNDPGYGPLVVTTNAQVLIDAISALTASGGGDLPELYYHGLNEALNVCERDSSVFTFTDAPAKDAYLRSQILAKASEMNIRVYSFYAGAIYIGRRKRQSTGTTDSIEALDGSDGHDIASATGGLTMGIQAGDANATAEYVMGRLARPESILTINLPGSTNLTFEVDDSITVINIDVSSTQLLSGSVELIDSKGNLLKPTPIAASNFFKLYKIQKATAGTWKLHSYYIGKHSIELSSDTSISCTTTLCEVHKGHTLEYMPLQDTPLVNQTDLVLLTVCENLPSHITNGSVKLINNQGTIITELYPSTFGKNGFITSIQIPDVDFRMLTTVSLADSNKIQRQAPQLISPTTIKIDLTNQPYIITGNTTLNMTYTIYNRAQATLNITLCITDSMKLLNTTEKCVSPYVIPSQNSITDQLPVFNIYNPNITTSLFTFTISAPANDSVSAPKVTNYKTVTLYTEDKAYEEASLTNSGLILLTPLCSI